MLKLGIFEERILSFSHDFEKFILIPRLQLPQRGTVHAVHVGDNAIRTADELMDLSIERLFADMSLLVGFLRSNLPRSIMSPLAILLIPNLIQRIITNWLIPRVPTDVEGIVAFQEALNLAVQFARTLDSYGWPGGEILVNGTKGIPDVWIGKRREKSLHCIRTFLIAGLGSIETVERVETQGLSYQEDRLGENNSTEVGREVEGSVEGGDGPVAIPQSLVGDSNPEKGEEEDDVSAWRLDAVADVDSSKVNSQENFDYPDVDDDDADAWGWGDDKDDGEPARSVETTSANTKETVPINGLPKDNKKIQAK